MAIHLPPMAALRAFEATARLGSQSRAAQALHVTHGAVSHQIAALEQDLGVTLIERAGRGIRLTDQGERFATRVRSALAELSEALRELADRANPGRLRVSMIPSFAARWLLPRVGRFVAAHPDIDLDIHASNALVDFRRDDIDVAIRYGSGHYPGLATRHLLDDEYLVVCSPRIAGGVPKQPGDLRRYILLRSDNEFWQPWFAAAGLDWPEPERGPIFNDTSHAMQAAIEGQGIALVRTSLLGNDLRNGVLVCPFPIYLPSPHHYYLVCPPRIAAMPKFVALSDWLEAEIAADPNRTPRSTTAVARTPALRRKGATRRRKQR
jgi:LysR family glycine cleavage system transcriptional activator